MCELKKYHTIQVLHGNIDQTLIEFIIQIAEL